MSHQEMSSVSAKSEMEAEKTRKKEVKVRLTWRQIARLTLQPKEVLTARGWSPRSLKSLEKDCVRAVLGRSSATTTQVLTRDKSNPRD